MAKTHLDLASRAEKVQARVLVLHHEPATQVDMSKPGHVGAAMGFPILDKSPLKSHGIFQIDVGIPIRTAHCPVKPCQ